MTNYLNKFFDYVANCEMFTVEKEAELHLRFKNHGDEDAREKLILSQSRLVLRRAIQFTLHDRKLLIEYFNVGMLAVIHTVDNLFDPSKGRLSSIAFPNICDVVRKFSHSQNIVKGMSLASSARIKRETGKITELNLMYPQVLSLDCKVGSVDSERTFVDFLVSKQDTPEELLATLECSSKLKRILADCMKSLSEREYAIIRERLFFDDVKTTLDALGERFGITRQRIQQIEKRARNKIMRYLKINYPDCRRDFGLLT